jgi:hypothetical protein
MRNGRRGSVLYVCVATLLLGLVTPFQAASQTAAGERTSDKTAKQQKKEILKKIKRSPDIPISFENSEGAPLTVTEATVKQISNAEFQQLVGFTTDSDRYSLFPKVTVKNNTGQRVTGFVVMVGDRQTRRIHGVKFHGITIEPNGSFIVNPSDWVRREKKVRVTDEGQVILNEAGQPSIDLDSEKIWMRARARDLVLIVGLVDFENGTRWMVDRNNVPW